jgi:hypothetical protein
MDKATSSGGGREEECKNVHESPFVHFPCRWYLHIALTVSIFLLSVQEPETHWVWHDEGSVESKAILGLAQLFSLFPGGARVVVNPDCL